MALSLCVKADVISFEVLFILLLSSAVSLLGPLESVTLNCEIGFLNNADPVEYKESSSFGKRSGVCYFNLWLGSKVIAVRRRFDLVVRLLNQSSVVLA